jgi:Spy/CpxP family protein refolding chaperone
MMAGAQAGQGRQMSQALVDYLKLTSEQQSQLRTLQTSMRDAIQPLTQQLRSKAQELRDALKTDPVDSAAVTRLRGEIQTLRGNIKAQRDSFATKSLQVLNADQQKLLEGLQQALTLQAAARQAARLGLITPPENEGAWGEGMMRRGFGPR